MQVSKLKRFFTIGMAGHIDHGKTTLTKALTGIDTDRLKEEKERNISIELGYAPLILEDDLEVSIVDVPGHERFIRQMIAGSAGIDFVILVIAANEGVMPQTEEHLNILSLLGIKNGIVVMTKANEADEELTHIVKEDIKEVLQDTFLHNSPIFIVDSLENKGIKQLKDYLKETIPQLPIKNRDDSFRLPIDQVFTLKGQGVIVRGTIFDGVVHEGDELTILPSGRTGRVRQIQSHSRRRKTAYAGQRTAINLSGISYKDIVRGDVLVIDDSSAVSNRIDVVLFPLKEIKYRVQQRLSVKVHIGTSEVNGKIIFFDRNDLNETDSDEVICQLQLDEKVVMKRGDRFIVRRATPVETIGGGWIIEPEAERHRFGIETVERLKQKMTGSATDRILLTLNEKFVLSRNDLIKEAAISDEQLNRAKHLLIEIAPNVFTTEKRYETVKKEILSIISSYHIRFPLRRGISKSEIVSELGRHYDDILVEYTVNQLIETNTLKMVNEHVFKSDFLRTYPVEWEEKLQQIEKVLIDQEAQPSKWDDLVSKNEIPEHIKIDFYHYLIETEKAYKFDEDRLISKHATNQLKNKLAKETEQRDFSLQIARDILQLSRKNLIPLLELFDKLGYTKRNGNIRVWS